MEIYVGNLSFNATEEDLTDAFGEFGAVSQVKIVTDRDTGRSRGFAFVSMDDADAAKTAIEELNGQEIQGRALSVREATPRAPRQGGGFGGGRGGNRGYDRGGDRGGNRGYDRGGERRGGYQGR